MSADTERGSVEIIEGDNLEAAGTLASGSFSLVYLDPPFNTGRAQERQVVTARRADTTPENAAETGGLSGKPLFPLATQRLAQMRQRVGTLPLVGVGGIHSPQTALAKFEAGANAVQLYSALVFGGLDLLDRIKRGLVAGVRSAGKTNISELVGTRTDQWARGEGTT